MRLPFIAVRWGEIAAAAGKVGRTVPVLDGLLAATALTFGLTFVTRNTEHVQETGVRLFDPWVTGLQHKPQFEKNSDRAS